jgi:hypothetical protein
MAIKTKKEDQLTGLERFATHRTLVFSGSLLVLSVTFNNVGIGKIIDAYSQQMVANIKTDKSCEIEVNNAVNEQIKAFNGRLTHVEALAHKETTKKN